MNPPADAWNELQREWQSLSTPLDAAQLRARIEREYGRMRRIRLAAAGLALLAVCGAALALLHTPTLGDTARALPVMALIAVAWWMERQRWRAYSSVLPRTTDSFLAVSGQRVRLQLRAVRLAWLIIAAELAFLVPWWIDGYRYHAQELLAPLTFLTVWLPAVFVLIVLLWTLRLHRLVRAEQQRLDQLGDSPEPG
jgi:hypothetical protein